MAAIIQIAETEHVAIEIGGIAISVRTEDPIFRQMLVNRYSGFAKVAPSVQLALDVDLTKGSHQTGATEDVRVRVQGQEWLIERGDFRARWNPAGGRGHVRQSRNPYAIDSVLRIIHTLILARQGGFLVHAASAICNRRAFLFAGVSGAGKTTISRLAPPDVKLLSDEISYVRRQAGGYVAYGTPFAGELARIGENAAAPLRAVFLLEKGPENRIETVAKIEAVRSLLRNILFFAEDPELVQQVFDSACQLADRVPVRKLVFTPDQRVWEIIRDMRGETS